MKYRLEQHTPATRSTCYSDGSRFLFYCHDTFGLGHFRRTLSLAKHFTAMLPGAEALIVTGSPLAHAFELPPRVDDREQSNSSRRELCSMGKL